MSTNDHAETLADYIDSTRDGLWPEGPDVAKAREALTALTRRLDRAEIEAIHQRDLANLANDRAAELSRKLAAKVSDEPPEGWRWIDGVLAHRDGRVATIGAFGMACHRRGSDESAMLPLDVARYLLAWRERGEPCPDCDGTGWVGDPSAILPRDVQPDGPEPCECGAADDEARELGCDFGDGPEPDTDFLVVLESCTGETLTAKEYDALRDAMNDAAEEHDFKVRRWGPLQVMRRSFGTDMARIALEYATARLVRESKGEVLCTEPGCDAKARGWVEGEPWCARHCPEE